MYDPAVQIEASKKREALKESSKQLVDAYWKELAPLLKRRCARRRCARQDTAGTSAASPFVAAPSVEQHTKGVLDYMGARMLRPAALPTASVSECGPMWSLLGWGVPRPVGDLW